MQIADRLGLSVGDKIDEVPVCTIRLQWIIFYEGDQALVGSMMLLRTIHYVLNRQAP